ncbi:50S ribosomal protein L11 methyltransferase [Desulfomonile tiedjei]|uniref:50S ribosomal protein L11 methyltransferase n=1 Tax=Desulfomonile tiedjei TaxID=2358 RepID=UPI00069389EC|nr:50S ribosomal protein L11 methyltransferase [Desulfomonile tiedjei]
MKRKSRKTQPGATGCLDVGERLRLVPYWERGIHKTDRLEIVLDPGPAFGIGDHPTTIIALEYLEKAVHVIGSRPFSLLDVGTGTGVLALAGIAMGSHLTLGLDIDCASVYVARWNLKCNSPDRESSASFVVGGVECARGKFDIVTANLAAPTLLRIRDQLSACVGKVLVLSGIAEVMKEQVLDVYSALGLVLKESDGRQEWNGALFVKASDALL